MPPSPAAALRDKRLLGDVRSILKNLKQWPTAAQPSSQFQAVIREKFLEGHQSSDNEASKARRQQANDYALMLKNLDRQKDIALVLSGERAPQRELVKLAAARCGLSVPEAPSMEGIDLEDGAKRGYTALRQTWRPDVKSDVTKKYSQKVEEKIGKELGEGK
ncbi:hypothetical protein NSK_000108 [Nannochloropsis salina CCMP1776]|uniref:Uncharacterized protein n=1 Tax=Nannochloropsis salina CCMP1776 TaxID=1027361 RepID=A0A4D9DBY6_9STRA|nr:hypothetical protein NSK_000108 [Nannochloropsis salina CCMP1776]|eukprot:TFJ88534.1 hypothetical protein NSK_000108 [Nannochloropsis salina CCMP1776]